MRMADCGIILWEILFLGNCVFVWKKRIEGFYEDNKFLALSSSSSSALLLTVYDFRERD